MVKLVILLSAVIAAASILIVYTVLKKKDKNTYSILMTAFSIFAALLFGVYQALPEPTPPSPPPTPPVTTNPPPTAPPPTAPTPVSEPQSLYGRALKRSVVDHVHYEDWEKANIITETYYDRKYADGTHKEWYTSAKYDDRNTGYTIGLYFADGLLFFASAYHVGEADAVTFYFWGDQMLACHNLIGGEDSLSYAGSDTYNYMVSAFGNIYEKAQLYAQDAE